MAKKKTAGDRWRGHLRKARRGLKEIAESGDLKQLGATTAEIDDLKDFSALAAQAAAEIGEVLAADPMMPLARW